MIAAHLEASHLTKCTDSFRAMGWTPTPFAAFRALARDQLRVYPNVVFMVAEVERISARQDGLFEFETDGGALGTARKVLSATGVFDQLPDLPGIQPLFGVSVHPCPYCDGWEMKDRRIAVYGKGEGI